MIGNKGAVGPKEIGAIILVLATLSLAFYINLGGIRDTSRVAEGIITKCIETEKTYSYYKTNIKESIKNKQSVASAELHNEFVGCFPNEKIQEQLKLTKEELFFLGEADFNAEHYIQAKKLLLKYKKELGEDENSEDVDLLLKQVDFELGFT
ncbi:hypothetical protein HQ529_05590 [Candidatus Woesearchaeota archaeon]|nr:hypothetical protein [Candidatus Woesearchaeota archaeon]